MTETPKSNLIIYTQKKLKKRLEISFNFEKKLPTLSALLLATTLSKFLKEEGIFQPPQVLFFLASLSKLYKERKGIFLS